MRLSGAGAGCPRPGFDLSHAESKGFEVEKWFKRTGNDHSLVIGYPFPVYFCVAYCNDYILRGFLPLGFICLCLIKRSQNSPLRSLRSSERMYTAVFILPTTCRCQPPHKTIRLAALCIYQSYLLGFAVFTLQNSSEGCSVIGVRVSRPEANIRTIIQDARGSECQRSRRVDRGRVGNQGWRVGQKFQQRVPGIWLRR